MQAATSTFNAARSPLGRPGSMTSPVAGARASRGGDRLLCFFRDLCKPRPGEAHRTFYRMNRSFLRGFGELSSLGLSSFCFGLEEHSLLSKAATTNAPLTGEATSGGQASEVRMTVPRPFGKLCLSLTSTSTLPNICPDNTSLLLQPCNFRVANE